MTTELLTVMTCCGLLVAGASCSPVSSAGRTTTTLDAAAASVYPPPPPPQLAQSRTRRYVVGHLLGDPYDADDYAAAAAAAEDSLAKRSGNGAWIWMPAQGYVSVSNSQQASGADVSGKHGRIMRYGK